MTSITMSSELNKRVVTGAVGAVALLLLIIFAGWIGVFAITLLLSLAMVHEFTAMVFTLGDKPEKRYLLLLASWFVIVASKFFGTFEYEIVVLLMMGLFLYFLFTSPRHPQPDFQTHFKELMYSIFGLVYLGFMPSFLQRLYSTAYGTKWVLLFLFMNWASDTGAYFVGKKYGKKKLFPLISPKKTWEGSYGAVGSALVVAILSKVSFFHELSWVGVVLLPPFISIASQLGDLCESFVKRAFDLKDSGHLLPGHGGFLDRFDGIVFSLPVMYALTRVFV